MSMPKKSTTLNTLQTIFGIKQEQQPNPQKEQKLKELADSLDNVTDQTLFRTNLKAVLSMLEKPQKIQLCEMCKEHLNSALNALSKRNDELKQGIASGLGVVQDAHDEIKKSGLGNG